MKTPHALLLALAALALPGAAPAQPTCAGQLVSHALGETCVPAAPKRVVALEWSYAEDLLAVGVQPVGVADVRGYGEWVKTPVALARTAADVGSRAQPSLEALIALKPDLIIAPSARVAQTYQRLSAIAPTVAFDAYPTDGTTQFEEMRATFTRIADLVGRRAQAKAVLLRLDAKLAQAKVGLERAGRRNERFVLAQGFTSNNAGTMRLFTKNSMASQLLERAGLVNAWGDAPRQYGFSTLGLEGLAALRTDNFFYIAQDGDNVFTASALAPLWSSLSFVKANRSYPLGGDAWLFGGPLSAEVLVDRVIGKLTAR